MVATKIFRTDMETLEGIIKRDPNVRLIFYIRDPRGILNSRTRYARIGTAIKAQSNAKYLCAKMYEDNKAYEHLAAR